MTYPEVIQNLFQLGPTGMKLGLEKMTQLAQWLGSPHERLRFIHVAGTNGKGSTCALLESIYRSAGLRVGFFTSPHLVHFSERIQVQRVSISDSDLISAYERVAAVANQFPTDDPATFFEFSAAMALVHFEHCRCDIVIWETGLGGRLDATNIVTPLASLITNIGLEHQQWLGDTHRRIAAEKAGIIKPGVPVFSTADHPDAVDVIRERSQELGSPLTQVNVPMLEASDPCFQSPGLSGPHQRRNAALALATVRGLHSLIPVSDSDIRKGLREARWAGRFDVIQNADETWVVDGAHNLEGAQALAATLREQFSGRSVCLIMGALKDKNWSAMLDALLPLAGQVRFITVQSERAVSALELAAYCSRVQPGIEVQHYEDLRSALIPPAVQGLKLVTGSLYLVGQLYEEMRWSLEGKPGERGLNEWRADKSIR